MAKSSAKVWLGFDDEFIHEKYKNTVDFTTNKIGGLPDFPTNTTIESPTCNLCHLPQLLIVQIYAPLDDSNTNKHRTLYVFACINPKCWNNSESWTCLRVQTADQTVPSAAASSESSKTKSATDWCQGADDWNDDNANFNEQNGNIINTEKGSDEDDESFSFEESVRSGIGKLAVADDQNANTGFGEAQGGAVGKLSSPTASAEIEGDEGEVITIDTPTIPQHNIAALLQEASPLPQDLISSSAKHGETSQSFHFIPYFLNVWEENTNFTLNNDHHVSELLQEYQKNNEDGLNFLQEADGDECGAKENHEKYEKTSPAHGDKLFHYFLSRIQLNPGQLLRYSRDNSSALLTAPLQEVPVKCRHCQGEMIFEFQILPTIIPKLRLSTDVQETVRLEFGNVLIYTCKRDCWPIDSSSLTRLETVIVQKEMY